MKSAYRIPDTPNNAVEPGTAPKATIPIGRLTVRSFITNVRDGGKGIKVRATSKSGEMQPMTAFWNPAGYLRNVVETVRVTAA